MLGIILANLNALTLAKFYNPDNPKDMIATVRAKIAETTLRAWFYFSVTHKKRRVAWPLSLVFFLIPVA